MNTNEMIKAWKNAEVETNENNSAVVNEELIGQIHGGNDSAGWVCTVSGECNGGTSCWKLLGDMFGG